MGRIIRHWQKQFLSGAFTGWQETARARIKYKRTGGKIMGWWEQRVLLKAWHQMEDTTSKLRRTKLLHRRIVKHWGHRQAATAFDTWSESTKSQVKSRSEALRVISRLSQSSLSKAWTSWTEMTYRSYGLGLLMGKIVRHWRSHALTVAFVSWASNAETLGRHRSSVSWGIARWTQRTLITAFNSIEAMSSRNKMVRVRMDEVVRRWARAKEARVFDTWHDETQSEKQRESREVSLAESAQQDRERGLKMVMGKVARHWRRQSIAAPFASWFSESSRKVHMRWTGRFLSQRLCRWTLWCVWDAIETSAQRSRLFDVLMARIMRLWTQSKVASCFDCWKQIVEGSMELWASRNRATLRWTRFTLAQVWAWLSVHAEEQRRLKRISKIIGHRWSILGVVRCWNSWQDVVDVTAVTKAWNQDNFMGDAERKHSRELVIEAEAAEQRSMQLLAEQQEKHNKEINILVEALSLSEAELRQHGITMYQLTQQVEDSDGNTLASLFSKFTEQDSVATLAKRSLKKSGSPGVPPMREDPHETGAELGEIRFLRAENASLAENISAQNVELDHMRAEVKRLELMLLSCETQGLSTVPAASEETICTPVQPDAVQCESGKSEIDDSWFVDSFHDSTRGFLTL